MKIKKIVAFILAFILVFSISCGEKKDESYKNVLNEFDLKNVYEDIDLPKYYEIYEYEWNSSDNRVLNNYGKVTRYLTDRTVKLTGYATGIENVNKFTVNVVVKGYTDDELEDFVQKAYFDAISTNYIMPSKIGIFTVKYISNNNEIIDNNGKITQSDVDTKVKLTIILNDGQAEKRLEINILVTKEEKPTPEPTVEEKLEGIINGLVLDTSINNLANDLLLPITVNGEYVIKWEIDEKYSEFARIENIGAQSKIVINRPASGEGFAKFELKGTISEGLTSVTRTWDDCYVRPQLAFPSYKIGNLFNATHGEYVQVSGQVIYVSGNHGYWIEDETGRAYVYANQEHGMEVGDIVTLNGEKDLYYSLLELRNVNIIKKEPGNYNYKDSLIKTTVTELAEVVPASMPYTKEDLAILGKYYHVSGRIVKDPNEKYTYALQDDVSGKSIVLYDSLFAEGTLEKLTSLEGKNVEMVIFFHDFYSSGFGRVIPLVDTIKESNSTNDFDDVKEVTIAEIMKNFDSYSGGTKLHITARIIRIVGDNMYLQDLEKTKFVEDGKAEYKYGAMYMFSGYGTGLGVLNAGEVISLDCQCIENEIYGKQLINPNRIMRLSTGEKYDIIELENNKASELGDYVGYVVSIKGLKAKDVYPHHENGDFTVVCETLNGEKINVRFEGQPKIKYSEIEIGKTYDVIGGVSKYGDSYQLMIGNRKGDASNDFKLSNVVSESTVSEFDIEIDGTTISKTEHLTIKDFKPGDSIEHKIKVVIDSEVSVKCTIKVITTGNLPLTFKIDENELNAVTKTLTYEQNVDPTGSTTVEILKTLEINYVTDGISDNYMDSYEVDIIVTAEQID